MRLHPAVAPIAFAASALALCAAADARSQGNVTVTSPAFENGGLIPVDFSCDGRGSSPPLQWSGLPPDTKSVAIVVEDPDAPKGPFTHWVVYDIPPGATDLVPGAAARHMLPAGAVQGKNSAGGWGWAPVCPPPGRLHHYHFKVFALRERLTLGQLGEGDLMRAMGGRIIAQGELVGTFQRQGH
jgi:Raf kinase inhibitor-like YbhB/YbcL family protein